MACKIDWEAIGRAVTRPAPMGNLHPAPAPILPSQARGASQVGYVTYQGAIMEKWQARDLIQERAAIMEYEAHMPRAEAELMARQGLA